MAYLYVFKGLFRRFRSFVLRDEVQIVGQCNICGECCRDILLQDRGRWLKHVRQFKRLCKDEPGHERFQIMERAESGHLVFRCSLQGEDNACTCYASRLPLCKSYPGKSLYYQGGWLMPHCGFSYKATSFREAYRRFRGKKAPKFSEVLQQELKQSEQK